MCYGNEKDRNAESGLKCASESSSTRICVTAGPKREDHRTDRGNTKGCGGVVPCFLFIVDMQGVARSTDQPGLVALEAQSL